jgi:hypothetical protein
MSVSGTVPPGGEQDPSSPSAQGDDERDRIPRSAQRDEIPKAYREFMEQGARPARRQSNRSMLIWAVVLLLIIVAAAFIFIGHAAGGSIFERY